MSKTVGDLHREYEKANPYVSTPRQRTKEEQDLIEAWDKWAAEDCGALGVDKAITAIRALAPRQGDQK